MLSHLRCSFTVTVFTISCFLLTSLSLTTGLLLEDLFLVREHFGFDFGKFFVISSFFCCVCFFFSNCVGVVYLERKWTHQCPDLGLFGFPARFFYLFGVYVLVFKSRAF